MKVWKLLIMEVDATSAETAAEEAQVRLDDLREQILPTANFGITLFSATPNDLKEFGIRAVRSRQGHSIDLVAFPERAWQRAYPHGRCARVGTCVEHAQDPKIEPCR